MTLLTSAKGALRALWACRRDTLIDPEEAASRAEDAGRGAFTFLGEGEDYGAITSIDWRDPQKSKLWRYHLHYHDEVQALLATEHPALENFLMTWIAHNPPPYGEGWEPYPISVRMRNWLFALAMRPQLPPEVAGSLYVQAGYLFRNLEHHLQGNHLFKNAFALFLAGIALGGGEGEKWRACAEDLIVREIAEQILPDGGHYERSPMYHALVLEDLLDLLFLAEHLGMGRIAGKARPAVRKMVEFLDRFRHPDGEIPLFNDAAFGMAPPTQRLLHFAQKVLGYGPAGGVERPLHPFEASGYAILGPSPHDRLLIDFGEIGPDYLPGHAHCDLASFELSLGGRRVVVDTGTSTYETNGERQAIRGTRAHNTVSVDSLDQSEIWGSFRVGARARPRGAFHRVGQTIAFLSVAHDGFARVSRSLRHRRTFCLLTPTPGRFAFLILDRVTGRDAKTHRVESFLHLHPDVSWRFEGTTLHCWVEGKGWCCSPFPVPFSVESSFYAPCFGVRLENTRFCQTLSATLPAVLGYAIHPEGTPPPTATPKPGGYALEWIGDSWFVPYEATTATTNPERDAGGTIGEDPGDAKEKGHPARQEGER